VALNYNDFKLLLYNIVVIITGYSDKSETTFNAFILDLRKERLLAEVYQREN